MSSTTAIAPRAGFDAGAERYDDAVNPVTALQKRALRALLENASGKTVIDLGCGTGQTLDLWREFNPKRLIGVDVSDGMLRRARGELLVADCCALPLGNAVADFASCCLTLGYLPDLRRFAADVARVLAPGGKLWISELHPESVERFGWKRAFPAEDGDVTVEARAVAIEEVLAGFAEVGLLADMVLEVPFGEPERELFERAGKLDAFVGFQAFPAIYVLRLRNDSSGRVTCPSVTNVANARLALSGSVAVSAGLVFSGNRLELLGNTEHAASAAPEIDLSGYLLLPGLINAHDHLEFALFPRLGRGGYRNSREWAEDIYRPDASPIREHLLVPKWVRLWWGAIRNLLAGVTTVCHHNPYESVFDDNFPVRVLRDFGWAHSLHFEPEVAAKHRETGSDATFLIHLAEGVDAASAEELVGLDRLGALDARTVVVHGTGLDGRGFDLLAQRGAGLVWCPSSNHFLFGQTLSAERVSSVPRAALGSDSPLTSDGDLLDELRFAHDLGVTSTLAYELVTGRAGDILRLKHGEGRLRPGSMADFIAVRDTGATPAERLAQLSYRDVELVVTGGKVRMVSAEMKSRLPGDLARELEPLLIDDTPRWVNAPVSELLRHSRAALGPEIAMHGRRLTQ